MCLFLPKLRMISSLVDKMTTINRGNKPDLNNLTTPHPANNDFLCSLNTLYSSQTTNTTLHLCRPGTQTGLSHPSTGSSCMLSSSSFCLKTDLKHLENLSIQLKCSSAFFPRNSGVTCDRLMDFSAAIYSHFPRAPQSLAKQRSSIMAPITMCSLCERIQGEELG